MTTSSARPSLQFHVDSPQPGAAFYRQRIPIEGWLHLGAAQSTVRRIVARSASHEIGATTRLYPRPDVSSALQLPPSALTGFRFLACFETPRETPTAQIELHAEFAHSPPLPLASFSIRLHANDHTTAPYGNLCNPRETGLLHREHLYSTGHPAENANPECVQLLANYLPPASNIFDVGCGVGAFHAPLRALGHTWTGCETSAACLAELARRLLPHRAILASSSSSAPSYRLPASDAEFDAVIAIEVLEHVRDPDSFLREIARVTRRHAFFSVPNLETLPFLSNRLVAPWHLLEGDHVSFFTRFNLRPLLARHFRHVEILDYGTQPLAAPDGPPLPYHLFALCEV